ncbi:uncharacterized protein [Henckelia pumila]|uniref:uncharacterized protein n=1 Tax=Henckelia pumila TaxID=405737 RepID=UPI003C6E018A
MESCSGGNSNFSFIGSCQYLKGLYLISIPNGATLMELFQNLGQKCPNINPEMTTLLFTAPHKKMEVTLIDNDDVRNKINLHMCMKLNIIEMRAERKTDQSHRSTNVGRVQTEDETHSTSGTHLEVCSMSNSIDSWHQCIRGVGQTFKDAANFQNCVKKYAIAIRRSFSYVKNDSQKIIVVCTDANCSWRIYASKYQSDNAFGIRNCNLTHSCGDDNLRTRGHPKADSSWVSNLVKDKLRGEPSYRPITMIKDIQRDFGVEIKYHKVWTGKEMAMNEIHGTEKGSYDKLRWYCHAVKETNPGSYAEYEIDTMTNRFDRLFICFHACLVGFVCGCRPLIFLDGTHIKNKYKGSILVAVAKDANDDLFTLEYAVVDAENDCNWHWHPGLIKAIQYVFPGSHHAYCLRHLVDNFVKQVLRRYPLHNKNKWSSVLKKAAYASSRHEFFELIKSITESMPIAQEFLVNSSPDNWANALFTGNRWGVINNNIAENWNSWVKPARHLPIVAMVDNIRIQIMTMMHERREKSLVMDKDLTPRKEKDVSLAYSQSRSLKVHRSCGLKFEVIDGDKTLAVDLSSWTCSCRGWQIYKLPCKHACACIESKSLSVYDFCDKYFTIGAYRESYKCVINPIPTFDMYEGYNDEGESICAPIVRSQPGRRRTMRIPSQVEHRLTKCGRCKKQGHNRRTCKEAFE